MPRVEVAGASLAYEIAGQGDALLLISGLKGPANFWHAQIETFSRHFTTIRFDQRGIGASTGGPPYSVKQWGRDVIALLDHLGIGAAHLVGDCGAKILPSGGHTFPRGRALDYNRMVLQFLLSTAQPPTGLASTTSNTPCGHGVGL
jgi:hypothetical protein